MYVEDNGNHKIRKITPSGIVTTYAGSGVSGSADGIGTSATFGYLQYISIDSNGNLFIPDGGKLRKIDTSQVVTSIGAISGGGIAVDPAGNFYLSGSNVIKKYDSTGTLLNTIGTGFPGSADGIATSASFKQPEGLVSDSTGNIYVADYSNGKIRKIDTSLTVSTLTSASAASITIDNSGNLYIYGIRKITPTGTVTTIVNTSGYPGMGIAVDSKGNIYYTEGHAIKKITFQ